MNKHGGYYGEVENMIDFSVNINPFGVSEKLRETIINGIDNIDRYPEIKGESAIKDIAKHYCTNEEQIVLGNGAIELIYLFARSIKPKSVMIVQPTFNEYRRAFSLEGAEIVNYILNEEDGFEIDIEDFVVQIEKNRPDVVVICNPNNPTGVYHSFEKIKRILDVINKYEGILFLDESFIDFSNQKSFIQLTNDYPLLVLRSMTKFYAVPGLRIGFCVANVEIAKRMYMFKEPWSVNYLSLIGVNELLNDTEYEEKTISWCDNERDFVYEKLSELENIKIYKSVANFHMCKSLKMSSLELQRRINKKGVFIRTCEDFVGLDESYFRVALKKHKDNVLLVEEMSEVQQL